MGNRQTQEQHQVLSHAMLQAVNILQMDAQQLAAYVRELAMENPMAELEEPAPPEPETQVRVNRLEWLSGYDEQNRAYRGYDREGGSREGLLENSAAQSGETLAETLRLQLIGGNYTTREMDIFDYIALNLDERGYFTFPPSSLAKHFSIAEKDATHYLAIMRDLDPPGVCAADLQNCLMKQLERIEGNLAVERAIVRSCMELLGKNQLHVIANKLGVPLERVKRARELIRTLNPKPAQGYAMANGEDPIYIVPDVSVIRTGNGFEVVLNEGGCPRLGVNRYYLKLMKEDCGEEAKEYLSQKLEQLEQIQQYIAMRGRTLEALARCIVDTQREFFLYGENELRPLRMREAAALIGVHESTVSRAVKGRWLQCSWGTYPLSWFFPSTASRQAETEDISSQKVKTVLKQLIEGENRKKPLSDQKLAEELTKRELPVSRRTVTKYREELGIENYRVRKSF